MSLSEILEFVLYKEKTMANSIAKRLRRGVGRPLSIHSAGRADRPEAAPNTKKAGMEAVAEWFQQVYFRFH
ncbi:hypothetical protein NXC24_PC01943 (plasmid) [Rhizobium sp. NXC24]|nr:hypothetical protein NXC24_PC01943 [Rhizobium sp. NXC24]